MWSSQGIVNSKNITCCVVSYISTMPRQRVMFAMSSENLSSLPKPTRCFQFFADAHRSSVALQYGCSFLCLNKGDATQLDAAACWIPVQMDSHCPQNLAVVPVIPPIPQGLWAAAQNVQGFLSSDKAGMLVSLLSPNITD